MSVICLSEASSEPYQTPKLELLAKIANGSWKLTIFAKVSTVDVWQGSEWFSEHVFENIWVS